MTFSMDDVHIKPEGMLMGPPTLRKLKSNILYTDLETIKILGRGATSKVVLAKHRPTSALYAVKELNALADDDTRRMACNELRIAHKHASHADHLVHFVDAFFHNDRICIAMEFCDAGSYEDVIRRTDGAGVPLAPLGALTLQLLRGLQYLHREVKQVHRDLKPANVMITRQGLAKLSDFGISKQLEESNGVAITQVRMGRPCRQPRTYALPCLPRHVFASLPRYLLPPSSLRSYSHLTYRWARQRTWRPSGCGATVTAGRATCGRWA
jgi:serine/threonine protein kinase